jgi:hypothetical protein
MVRVEARSRVVSVDVGGVVLMTRDELVMSVSSVSDETGVVSDAGEQSNSDNETLRVDIPI